MNDGGTQHGLSRRSMTIAAFSTVVEWYDFTLYLYLATVLSRVFYGGGTTSLAVTLGGFAVSYLMRPLGALVFGQVGDRFGRRRMMLLSMALMTLAMLGIALLPTRDAIGPAAGWLLLALRCVMAFSVGGEYTGVVAYLYEGAQPERRGFITSSASAASEVGGLLAVGISAAVVSWLTAVQLETWGWRIPFFIGAALAATIGIARSTLQESPEFERQQRAGSIPANPIGHALTHHRAAIARGFAISALGSITYYVGIVYVPSFLTSTGAMGEGDALWLATAAAVMVIAVTPLVGLLSDHVGRKPVLIAICIAAAILPMTMFAWMAGAGSSALIGALVLAALGGAMSAVGAVATAEQLPGEGRLSGLALGATAATAIFGGLTPLVSHWLLESTGWVMVPGAMIAVVALAVAPALLTLRAAPHAPIRD
ncbi:MFS transporter [Sphingomonas hankookensis]|uniref:MFS transporter n=2 Tax=Sphingomonas TaxID=13687 RepID=A0ABR5YGK4_9SPHN|nr:MFS transporter [Sphingomonas hankookensis]